MLRARRTGGPDHCLAVGANRLDEPLREPVTVGREQCEMCPFQFIGKADLWRHVRAMHSEEDRLVCRVAGCHRSFATLAASFAHWVHHTRVGAILGGRSSHKRAHTCELCGRLFGGRRELREHVATRHPDARGGMCGVCGRFKGEKNAVRIHVRSDHSSLFERVHGPLSASRRPRVRSHVHPRNR